MKVKIKESRSYGQVNRGRDMELLQEAVENIIPPAFDELVKFCKDPADAFGLETGNRPEESEKIRAERFPKGAQDTLAKYISVYGLLHSYEVSRGQPSPGDISGIFYRSLTVPRFEELLNDELWKLGDRYEDGTRVRDRFTDDEGLLSTDGDAYERYLAAKKERMAELVKPLTQLKRNFQRTTGRGEADEDGYVSAADSFDARFMDAMGYENRGFNVVRRRDSKGATVDEDPQKALVILGQQYKSHMKQLKKFFKKHPLGDKHYIQREITIYIEREWVQLQSRWIFNHLYYKFEDMVEYMWDHKGSWQKFDAIFNDNPYNIEHYEQTTAYERSLSPRRKPTSLELVNDFLDEEKIKKQYGKCEGGWNAVTTKNRQSRDYPDGENACVLKVYENGKFWWNRDQSSCELAGDEMANCGSANMEDSVLIILKQKITNQELNEENDEPTINLRDKVKGRIMVEYNPRLHELVQILGFANSFPEEEHWPEIKDLYVNLDYPKISNHSFEHLRRNNRTGQERINKFFEYINPESDRPINQPPESFWGNDMTSMFHRLQNREYNHTWEENFWRNIITISSKHRALDAGAGPVSYAPIIFRINVTAPFNREKYAMIQGKRWLSRQDPVLHAKASKSMVDHLEASLAVQVDNAMLGIEPQAGAASEIPPELEVSRVRFQPLRGLTNVDGVPELQMALKYFIFIKIQPEWFTDEGLDYDDPQPEEMHVIITSILRRLKEDQLNKLTVETLEDWYEHMEGGGADEVEAEPKTYDGEAYEDERVQRWILNKDSTNAMERRQWMSRRSPARRRMMRFLDDVQEGETLDAVEEAELEVLLDHFFEVLPVDYQNAVDMARGHDEDIAGQEGEGHPDTGIPARFENERYQATAEIRRWFPEWSNPANPTNQSIALQRATRILNAENPNPTDQVKAEMEVIWHFYGGRWPDYIQEEWYTWWDEHINRPEYLRRDDGDEEDDGWRPGMPTPGEPEYADLTQGDPNAVADAEEEVHSQVDDWEPGQRRVRSQEDTLFSQANMILRRVAAGQNAGQSVSDLQQAYPGIFRIFDRVKSTMKGMGLYDRWVDSIDDNHPLWRDGDFGDLIYGDDNPTLREARSIVNKILDEKKSGAKALVEGDLVDFQTGQETTVDEHFLDFLEEKIPTLDVEDPAQVMAVIRAIENSDTAEQVFNKLEQQGLVTRHMDSAYETTMHQIQQIQSIMTSHWFTRMDQMDSRPPPNMPNGSPMSSHLNEKLKPTVTTLRVFDFDETIAFTKAETRVTEPSGKVKVLPDQDALDTYFYNKGKELAITNPEDPSIPPTSKHIEDALSKQGYELDFSDFSNVREPKENEPVIAIIRRMVASYASDPRGVVYVVTARSQASEGPIKTYLGQLGIEIDRDKIIGVTGGSKKQEIERLMNIYSKDGATTITKIEFFDDSDKNLADVRQLKSEYPQINTILRKVDHGNIKTVKEQKRKLLKVRIGAK